MKWKIVMLFKILFSFSNHCLSNLSFRYDDMLPFKSKQKRESKFHFKKKSEIPCCVNREFKQTIETSVKVSNFLENSLLFYLIQVLLPLSGQKEVLQKKFLWLEKIIIIRFLLFRSCQLSLDVIKRRHRGERVR